MSIITSALAILFSAILLRFIIKNTFEDNPYHPFAYYCQECFKNHEYFVDRSFKWIIFQFYYPLIVFFMLIKKNNIYQTNDVFYNY